MNKAHPVNADNTKGSITGPAPGIMLAKYRAINVNIDIDVPANVIPAFLRRPRNRVEKVEPIFKIGLPPSPFWIYRELRMISEVIFLARYWRKILWICFKLF